LLLVAVVQEVHLLRVSVVLVQVDILLVGHLYQIQSQSVQEQQVRMLQHLEQVVINQFTE
jgi:hypothetical protein